MQQADTPKSGVGIEFSEDGTELWIYFQDIKKEYKKENIFQYLTDVGVTTGIHEDVIDNMLTEKEIGKKYLVAESKKPIDGKDGWFEFLFSTNIDTKPKILQDGSVDYSEYGDVPFVEEGQKLVIYHPATESQDGENFQGETVVAKKGKELARLKGKGFSVSEDGKEYLAKHSGRATYINDRLVVDNELVIEGDVSLTTGDVSFVNDIHIHGNVLTGVTIKSEKGSIIVDGYVEASELHAANDVVLKNGMQGSGKGKIIAGGSVSGKFFEQSTVESGGDVNANAIMNSYITARRDVLVSGRFGIIIGGEIRAERHIIATIIGNMAEVKTMIYAGVEEDLFARLMLKEKEEAALEQELQKIVNGINQIDIMIEKTQREDLRMQKIKLIRSKVEKESAINIKIREKQSVMDQMSRANNAKVKVQKVLYPGTKININGVMTNIREEANHVEINARGSVIEVS